MQSPRPDLATAPPLPLLARAAAVDEASQLELQVISLFDIYRTRLLAYVRTFGLTGHDGEEVVQEVFLSLFHHLRHGKSQSNLRGWLFRVAHNLSLRRRNQNQRWHDPLDEKEQHLHTASANPEEHALASQRQSRLWSVVNALAEQDRQCLTLRAEGLRYREIARVTGMSLGSVSISLTRSLARLMRADTL